LHEKCEAAFAAANTGPATAPVDDGLEVPSFLKRSGIQKPGGGLNLYHAPLERPDCRPSLTPDGDNLSDFG
jgi:hypothetical protein